MSAGPVGRGGWVHPLVCGGLVVLAVRLFAIAVFFLAGGQVNGPFNFIPIASAYHSAILLVLVLLLLVLPLARRPGLASRLVIVAGLVLLAVTLLAGLVEFLLLRHTGHKLSAAVLRTYAGPGVLTKEVLAPLAQDRGFTALLGGTAAAGLAVLALLAWRGRPGPVGRGPFVVGITVVAALCFVVWRDRPLQRAYVRPPELALLDTLLPAARTPAPGNEAAALADLRALTPLAPGWRWTGPEFPLQREAGPEVAGSAEMRARREDRPDIVLIAVESLCAEALWFAPSPDPAVTPNLRRLADRGVRFDHFLSNGFPSAEGFFSLHSGLWPHPGRAATVDSAGTRFEALPERLGRLGYHRIALWGGDASFDHELSWARVWYDESINQAHAGEWIYSQNTSDAEFMQRAIAHGRAHDAAQSGRPLFLFLANGGTHGPFVAGVDFFATPEQRAEAQRINPDGPGVARSTRYRRSLELFDRQLGRLIDWLDSRPRAANTVIVVLGDHAVSLVIGGAPLDSSLPEDDTHWTGAVIAGPARLIGGQPRVEKFPASQVDILPTLLALAGDTAPQAGPGVDLFAPIPASARAAVAIRPGGFRLDRLDRSLIVPANATEEARYYDAFMAAPRGSARPAPAEAESLSRAVRYWSYLLEQNRVLAPAR